ncbi:cytochrome P450 [Xylariomycetidae sp. FL0641]|nr:cytochrome P450 [Xylariomycetidae sp. FL0641]
MMYSNTTLCLICGLVVVLLARWLMRSRTQSYLPLPPGPPRLPVIGNLHQAPRSRPWLQYYEWSKVYGPVMYLNVAGQPVVILSTIQVAQDLISKRGNKYADRPRMVVAGELATRGLHVMLMNNTEAFRKHQKLEAPFLMPRAAKTYLPIQDLESKQLLFDLMMHGESPRGVGFHTHFERTTASGIYTLIYGRRLRTISDAFLLNVQQVQKVFGKMLQVGAYLVDSFPSFQYLPLPSFCTQWKKEGEENYQQQRALHVENMQRGLQSAARWNLSKAFNQNPQSKHMSTEELAFDLGVLADAALDTTTMTLDWFIVACITQSGSGFVAKAQHAIDVVVGRDRLPTYTDKPRLPYISAIVEELLRWRPVAAAGVAHAVRIEDEYEGYRIPAGSTVLINHWALCRDPAFGDRVEDFVPERWIADGQVRDYFGTPVFGYGRRICPGRHIARDVLWIQVARMLWAFRIEPGMTEAGRRGLVDPDAGTTGLLTKPPPFNAQFLPRGEWVRLIIERDCADAVDQDPTELLNQVATNRF